MLGLLGRIFGSEKALTGIVSAARDGLDALVYTDQEREHDAAKERAQARGMVVEWMETTKGQNLARRMLAFMIAGTWLFMYLLSASMQIVVVWVENEVTYARLLANAQTIGDRSDGMTGAMMLILGFYFAAPHIGNIIGPALARFGKTTEPK